MHTTHTEGRDREGVSEQQGVRERRTREGRQGRGGGEEGEGMGRERGRLRERERNSEARLYESRPSCLKEVPVQSPLPYVCKYD